MRHCQARVRVRIRISDKVRVRVRVRVNARARVRAGVRVMVEIVREKLSRREFDGGNCLGGEIVQGGISLVPFVARVHHLIDKKRHG